MRSHRLKKLINLIQRKGLVIITGDSNANKRLLYLNLLADESLISKRTLILCNYESGGIKSTLNKIIHGGSVRTSKLDNIIIEDYVLDYVDLDMTINDYISNIDLIIIDKLNIIAGVMNYIKVLEAISNITNIPIICIYDYQFTDSQDITDFVEAIRELGFNASIVICRNNTNEIISDENIVS